MRASAEAASAHNAQLQVPENPLQRTQSYTGELFSQRLSARPVQEGIQQREQEVMQLVQELRSNQPMQPPLLSARKEAESGEEAEASRLREQVAGLKADLLSALAERGGGGGPDADACLLEVLELRQELRADAQGAAALKSLLHRAQRGRSRAQAHEAGLKVPSLQPFCKPSALAPGEF